VNTLVGAWGFGFVQYFVELDCGRGVYWGLMEKYLCLGETVITLLVM
jgi:hypothetical protein